MKLSAVVLLGSSLLGGCATTPDAGDLLRAPAEFKTLEGVAPVRDERGRFRTVFCSVMREDGAALADDRSCERWLWRLPDEAPLSGGPLVADAAAASMIVYLVTGAFSECVGDKGRPFRHAVERLLADGVRVGTIVVAGRSGTQANARQIADVLEKAAVPADQKLVLIGYSKGALDILRFVVDFPALADSVDAVVSVAGPIFGTPLADTAAPTYAALLDRLPYHNCPPGDGGVIESLRPATATQWLAANRLPERVQYYSLAGFTTREHVARALMPFWKHLNRIEPRNDGQVIATDAVIPGSTLLGYANTDHWGIAETIESVYPMLVARQDPTAFPLEQLLISIVALVADDLARAAPGAAAIVR